MTDVFAVEAGSLAERPIGVFDSGLGGLTIVRALRERLPSEHLLYVGDTAHLPYGDKSPELVRHHALAMAEALQRRSVKAIVLACNTASSVAFEAVQARVAPLPVFNVISPAVDEALRHGHGGQIGIIGTKTTVNSQVYPRLLAQRRPQAAVVQKATPLLVPMIEEGWLHKRVSQDVIDAYMSDTGFQQIDTLILGCTHYPLIKSQIANYFVENYEHPVYIVDSSEAVARAVQQGLSAASLLRNGSPGTETCYLTDLTPHFEASARLFMQKPLTFSLLPELEPQEEGQEQN